MAFKQVQSLDADVTIRLGGADRKTGKKNPTQVEGYFLGTRQVDSPKSKTGKASIHFFQTEAGNIGVWGKTDMDKKLSNVVAGTMTRVSFTGMKPTPNGDMYKFAVEVDEANVLDAEQIPAGASLSQEADAEEMVTGAEDEEPADEVAYSRPVPPKVAASTPSAESQARVKALLAKATR